MIDTTNIDAVSRHVATNIRRQIEEAFAKKPDEAGILQGVRYLRGGVTGKRIVLHPSAKNGGTIPCEGRPEGNYAASLEIDPRVKGFRGQPVEIPGPHGGTLVPDFVIQYTDDTYALADVKAAGKLLEPDVAERMHWIRRVLSQARIPHHIITAEALQSEPHRTIRRALRKGARINAHLCIQKAAEAIVRPGPTTVQRLRQELVALGYPSFAVEKLVLMERLSFDASRAWSSSTLIGDIHGPASRVASRDTIHAVLI